MTESELQEILETQALLAKRLPDDPSLLLESARDIECRQARIMSFLADASHDLAQASYQRIMTKAKDVTELDRTLKLKADVAAEQKAVDLLSGLVKSIATRISLIQSTVKAHSQESARFQV